MDKWFEYSVKNGKGFPLNPFGFTESPLLKGT